MAVEILMPALSPTMEEGTLAKWLVSEGASITSGDLLAEIETDKATMEFEAVDDGVIGKILIAEGTEAVKVNSVIAILLEEGEKIENVNLPTEPPKSVILETNNTKQNDVTNLRTESLAKPLNSGTRIFSSPLARRLATENKLDLSKITGSGPHGRIIKQDVEKATASIRAESPNNRISKPSAQTPKIQSNDVNTEQILKIYQDRDFGEISLDGMRKTVASRLTEAKQTIPHFYLRRDIKLDALLKFREEINQQLASKSKKLSVNDFVIKACALALQQVPAANAVWAHDRIIKFKASDIAVAVAVEGGLFTPVIKDAHQKSLSEISIEMKDLAKRARERKLSPHEYVGGSFSISNLGMFGIDNFDAVINPPQAAILAVGAGSKKPIVGEDGELTIASMMSITLSVDHRVIDGALGAQVLAAITDNIESPLTMLV
ncbi:MAG: pyruvate dehydrogenase complex dihydrolipoamide acetyltransferase [Aestuariivita sp.]|nr:pyruvate dehydrogenase complex dihydrolipoamide acetyltransferase [Aestuariivita sp.]